MIELRSGLHVQLNDRMINALKSRNILTVSEFLRIDSTKLNQYLNIDLNDVWAIKKDFWALIGIDTVDGLEHYRIIQQKHEFIASGIQSIDKLLNGGLTPGNLIDVCGLSAAGKTQLHTTIAVNWSIQYDYETFVIDTKCDFSGDRINRILMNRSGLDSDRRKQIMRNIKVQRCNSLIELIQLIRHLLDQIIQYPRLKFVVIDSMPSIWFLYHGTKTGYAHVQLAKLADLLRKLAVEYGIVVMTVNIETRSNINNVELLGNADDENMVDAANCSIASDTQVNRMNALTPTPPTEINVPALGKHWKQICSLRLQLQKPFNVTNSNASIAWQTTSSLNERTVRIIKSNQHPIDDCCVVRITDAGIT